MATDLLERIDIPIPCSVPWSTMTGTERTRFCNLCSKNVFNISEMSREEAEELIGVQHGELCVRFYRRADDTVITSDCGRGGSKWKGRILGAGAFVIVLLLSMIGWMFATERREDRYDSWMRRTEPFRTVLEWVDPSPVMVMGSMLEIPGTPPPNNESQQ